MIHSLNNEVKSKGRKSAEGVETMPLAVHETFAVVLLCPVEEVPEKLRDPMTRFFLESRLRDHLYYLTHYDDEDGR